MALTDKAGKLETATQARVVALPSAAKSGGDGLKLPSEEMVKLYCAILRALPDASSRVIEVISANAGEGVSTVARELAAAAAAIANARVLLCDATPKFDDLTVLGVPPSGTLNEVSSGALHLQDALEAVPDRGFTACALADPGKGVQVAVNIDTLDPVFTELRNRFDFVVVDAPQVNGFTLGTALARKADGVILVVEAERTRMPVLTATQRTIEANGGKILGVVLNKRRFHVPPALYRLF